MIFETTHKLPFEVARFIPGPMFQLFGVKPDADFKRFKIGTCEGLWRCKGMNYEIMAVINEIPGNGHFTDVLEWFENSCKRDKKNLVFLELMNEPFKQSLIKKGFQAFGKNNLIKIYK